MSANANEEPRDEILLAAAASGDFDAFHAFYDRWSGRVLAYARRLSRDSSLAEDLTQEVFAAVWSKAGTFQPDRGGAAAWLYTLTRNKLVDHWRRSGGDAGARTLDDQRLSAPPGEDGDLRLLLRQALAYVPPEQRQAIEMAFFGGLTYAETAGRLAVPVGTLKSRIRLGLRAMRAALA